MGSAPTFAMLIEIARRQAVLIAAVVALTFCLGLLLIARMPTIYTATAIVIVDPSAKDLLRPADGAQSIATDTAKVDSELELVRPDNVLMAVIDELKLSEDPQFAGGGGLRQMLSSVFGGQLQASADTSGDRLVRLLDQVRAVTAVRRVGLTNLITIQARSTDPGKAADLANSIADSYISTQLNSKITSLQNARAILSAEQTRALAVVTDSNRAYSELVDQVTAEYGSSSENARVSELQSRLQRSVEQRDLLSAGLATAEEELAAGQWSALAARFAQSGIAELDAERTQLIASIETETDPVAAEGLNGQLSDALNRLGALGGVAVQGLRVQLSRGVSEQSDLRQQIRTAVLESDLPPDILASLFELQQKSQVAVQQYESLVRRNEELGTQAALQVADSRVASPALPPVQPSSPNIPYLLGMAVLASLAAGGGLAVARDYVTGGITSEAQARQLLRLPRLASIPLQKDGASTTALADHIPLRPLSRFSESIRRVRSLVDADSPPAVPGEASSKVIAVMSAHPDEGKTMLALAMARSYALSGQKVLLIDADLRRPGLHKVVGLEPRQGLLEILQARDLASAIQTAVQPDPQSSATLMLGTTVSREATDQFVSGNGFRNLLQASRRLFDVIIVDTPPLEPVVDGVYISKHADRVMFVIEWETTKQTTAKAAIGELAAARGSSSGIFAVLNKSREALKFSVRRDSSYYYE